MKGILAARQNQQKASKILLVLENLNRGFGYLRNLVVSWVVGFGTLSDLYFLVFGLASGVSSIVTGAISATFIPYSTKLGSSRRRDLLGALAVLVTGLFLVIVTCITVIVLITSNSVELRQIAGEQTGLSIAAGLIIGFAAMQLLQLADEFFRSRKNFIVGGSLILTVNAFATALLYFGVETYPGLLGFAIAIPASLLAVWLFGVVRVAHIEVMEARPFVVQALPLMMSGFAGMLNVFIDRWFASGFDPGRLSLMQTAFMLITQIGGAVIAPLVNSAYPFISTHFARKRITDAQQLIAKVELRVLVIVGLFITGYLFFGELILNLIYRRGAVSGENVKELFAIGWWYMPVLVYGSFVSLYLRVLYCDGETKRPAAFSVGIILINIALNLAFVEQFGWKTLAASASFCSWLYFILLVLMLHRRGTYRHGMGRFAVMQIPAIVTIAEVLLL